jgi:hypothetical protein
MIKLKKALALPAGLFAALNLTLAPATPASAATTPIIYTSFAWSGAARQPASIAYTGGGNVFLDTPHWSSWKSTYAYGRGTLYVNQCQPYCAVGKYK